MFIKRFLIIAIFILIPSLAHTKTIDVHIKGVDDGVRATKQQDYKEAVLFAKREAIERAGVQVKALTTVRDFVVQSDYIESTAEAVLLPGYSIVDVGYQPDGTYLIILIGKIRTITEGIESKELRYAKSLVDRGDRLKAKSIVDKIINSGKDDKAVAEAMYYQVVWELSENEIDTADKLKAYFPNSEYVGRLQRFLAERKNRFNTKRNGIILDTKTGHEWYAGPNVDTNWQEAESWAKNLNFAGGGWTMPSRKELVALFEDLEKYNLLPVLEHMGLRTYYRVWSDDFSRTSKYGPTEYYWMVRIEDAKETDYAIEKSARINKRAFAIRYRKNE